MSEEIEKIIFNLEGCCEMFDYMLTPIENNLLVSYIKELQQKSQQLKTDLKEANDNATWWNNRFNAVSKENKLYKSVLDEIKEQLKKIEPDLDFEPWSIYTINGDKLFDLLQILEKVGSNE